MIVDIVGYGVTPNWARVVRPHSAPTVSARHVDHHCLTKSFLKYNQNPNGIGTGSGLCFGDSGSPQFEEGTLNVLSVTTGGNGQCNSSNSNYRVDTPLAREFLGQFLDLP